MKRWSTSLVVREIQVKIVTYCSLFLSVLPIEVADSSYSASWPPSDPSWTRVGYANTSTFYIRDLSLCGFWCPQKVLEQMPHESRGTAVSPPSIIIFIVLQIHISVLISRYRYLTSGSENKSGVFSILNIFNRSEA